ncbi:hypothetical protein chiPu_0016111 [Chiloscyllium punctatum]|uniref:Uncharacterized protein n=1 Tax=Chiloscyllium punctatum TaxID=137246 RepID=A0A401T4S0_CHIPU|nr:hypothetical protein [Chiloscyllium punctatum]
MGVSHIGDKVQRQGAFSDLLWVAGDDSPGADGGVFVLRILVRLLEISLLLLLLLLFLFLFLLLMVVMVMVVVAVVAAAVRWLISEALVLLQELLHFQFQLVDPVPLGLDEGLLILDDGGQLFEVEHCPHRVLHQALHGVWMLREENRQRVRRQATAAARRSYCCAPRPAGKLTHSRVH